MPALLLSSNYTFSSFTVSGMADRVLGDLALRNSNFITSGDCLRWGEAQTILARDTKCFHVTALSGVTSGTSEYPLISDSIGRCIGVESVLHGGTPLPLVTVGWLDGYYPYWRTAPAGTPLYYYVRGFSSIGLYPCPATTSGDALRVVYTALPPEVTEPNQNFYVMHGLEDALIMYAKLQASLKDASGEGKERIDYYAQWWEKCQARAQEVAGALAQHEVVQLGEDALFAEIDPLDFSPHQLATSL
jgi:hypothetical protein